MVLWEGDERVMRGFNNGKVQMERITHEDESEVQRQLITGWHRL